MNQLFILNHRNIQINHDLLVTTILHDAIQADLGSTRLFPERIR